jgi:hypothetical protein
MPALRYFAPDYIVEHCRSPVFREGLDALDLDAIERLLKFDDMGVVWTELTAPHRPRAHVWDFLHRCATVRWHWIQLSRVPGKALEKRLHVLARQAEALAKGLRLMPRELELQGTPLNLQRLIWARPLQLSIGADRRELDSPPVQNEAKLSNVEKELPHDEIWDGTQLNAFEKLTVPHLLDALAMSLRASPTSALDAVRPTKMNILNPRSKEDPERTFYVRAMTRFFLTHGGEPRYDFVAYTVTALLDLGNHPMERRHAQLVSEDLEGRFGDENEIDWSLDWG